MSQDAVLPPDLETWQELFRAGIGMRDLEPWQWLAETDLFGVRDPATGELCTCCVFGQGGDVRGLSAYRGADGLDSLLRLLTGDFDRGSPLDHLEAYLGQHCLVAIFETDRDPDPRDEAIASRIGLHGTADLPRFRSHWPGHEPWYLDPDEVTLLTLVLDQAVDLARRARGRSTLLEAPTEDVLRARVPDLTLDGLAWRDAWVSPPPGVDLDRAGFELDATRLHALRRLPYGGAGGPRTGRSGSDLRDAGRAGSDPVDTRPGNPSPGEIEQPIWELDFFISATPVQDHPDARPYYPFILLAVDQESGRVVGEDAVPYEQRHRGLRELLVRAMEEEAMRPVGIWARRDTIADALYPLASCAELHVERVAGLRAMDAAHLMATTGVEVGVGAL